MRMKRYFRAVLALAMVAALLSGSAMAASMGAKVLTASMPVYNAAAQQIGVMGRSTAFEVTAINGGWARISYRGYECYAPLSNMVFDARIPAVTNQVSNIRFMTQDSYSRGLYYTGTLARGIPMYIAGINGDYLLFFNTTGSIMGYVPRYAVTRVG